ncbi:MAG: hypothetical protein ABJF01_15525 [bacterium]
MTRQANSFSRRRSVLGALSGLVIAASLANAQTQSTIPARLTDKELWQLNADFSEPSGYFRSENFLSNETGFQYVIPDLKRTIQPGGVYLGVGPEQNFTYIVALQPKMAIIFDIRRGNMIEHLMYKSLFELSADRAEFLSRLFSRPRPSGLDASSTPQQLFDAYIAAKPDSDLYKKNLATIKDRLTKDHGFAPRDEDMRSLENIYSAFFGGGPQINYNYPSRTGSGYGGGGMPTYASLQNATDSAGKNWAYLATEANYRWLRDFEAKNLLIPIVGDFAGPKAIRSVAKYLKDHGAIASAFYTSNVEQYLFQQNDDWSRYYKNVAELPTDSTSLFIRSIGGGRGLGSPSSGAAAQQMRFGGRLASVTCSIQDLVKAFNEGKVLSYADVINMSR